MRVINPTDKDVSAVIFGTAYTIPAKGHIDNVPAKDASFWKNKVHGFLQLELDGTDVETEAPIVVEETTEEVQENEEIQKPEEAEVETEETEEVSANQE